MPQPGVHIETLANPAAYSRTQLERVCEIAGQFKRGRFILCEPPAKCVRCLGRPSTFCVKCGAVSED